VLGELGYTVAAEAARIEEALEATKNADFDLATLDANLNSMRRPCCRRAARTNS
jgi:CheY-like chemotaxis protein